MAVSRQIDHGRWQMTLTPISNTVCPNAFVRVCDWTPVACPFAISFGRPVVSVCIGIAPRSMGKKLFVVSMVLGPWMYESHASYHRVSHVPSEDCVPIRTQLTPSVGGRSKFWNRFAPNKLENGLGAFSPPEEPPTGPLYCGVKPVDC
jgi:hypothetical protein